MLRARWSVNLRPAAAWGQSLGVLREGQCFQVADITQLPAAGLSQIWASGKQVPCP